MNSVAFSVVESDHDSSAGEIQIMIDGLDLRELVRRVELNNPDASEIAGAYAGLRADADVLPPARHFLGEPRWGVYDYGGKTQILGCDCGEPGCWPLICRITVSEQDVRWSDFEQPHRAGSDASVVWRYDSLGPFRFPRGEYEAALAMLPTADAAGIRRRPRA